MPKQIAVLISDIHFNINTLNLASKSLKAAIDKSNELKIPLIIAGDLNDTKAIIRAEVANSIIEILKTSKQKVIILVGNHDLVNEKMTDNGLNYLKPYALIANEPGFLLEEKVMVIPYYSNADILKEYVKYIIPGTLAVMHQGFKGAFMGDYIQDKTSLSPEEVSHLSVFSGHYHRHQTLCSTKEKEAHKQVFGKGTITYIGSPYTVTFGEANDGPKGFLVVNEDGSFTREILELRKHIIVERNPENALDPVENYKTGDLLWVKVRGEESKLNTINKTDFIYKDFKLDLIPEDKIKTNIQVDTLSNSEIMDKLIDNVKDSEEHKKYLKSLWRQQLNET